MYSREKRMKAVELYSKYGKSAAAVIRELGYPDRKTLPRWYKQHLEERRTGVVRDGYSRAPSHTARTLGYPCRPELANWYGELAPEECKRRGGGLNYAKGREPEGAEERRARESGSEDGKSVPLRAIVSASRFSGCSLRDCDPPGKEVESDVSEIDDLKRLREELRLREEHPLKDLLAFVGLSRSTYFYRHGRMTAVDRHAEHREKIRTLFVRNHERYGYRRIHAGLRREGAVLSEKIVRRPSRRQDLPLPDDRLSALV